MISYNKYDFYQSNKKIFSTSINDALNDLVIKKSVHTNFEIKHISSINNIYPNSVVFINSNSLVTKTSGN